MTGGPDLDVTNNYASVDFAKCGDAMHRLMAELFPICRSITGKGVRETLRIIQQHIPLTSYEIPSGTEVLDWTIPKEWSIRDAYVLDDRGEKLIDFRKNNLHVVSYSMPVNKTVTLTELQQHLYSLEDQPDAIPYVTSYYEERWGFCLTHDQRVRLKEGAYQVVVDSEFVDGSLTYGELLIRGSSEREVFLSTYVCHPSMANNELSGPVVTTFLAKWIASRPRRYSYRIVFIPETIGSIAYLSRNLEHLQANMVAGFNVTCVGDERAYSYLPSRNGSTLADRAALNILTHNHPDFIRYSYLARGSDERQYCSPGVDLPVASIMRSKYREYPEYHTSLDNLSVATPAGLQGGFAVLQDCLDLLERNRVYRATCLGEPQLGKRGLYPPVGTKKSHQQVKNMLDVLAYADGTRDLIEISDLIDVPVSQLYATIDRLVAAGVLAEQNKAP
jgi:aminopeptidase-like protein